MTLIARIFGGLLMLTATPFIVLALWYTATTPVSPWMFWHLFGYSAQLMFGLGFYMLFSRIERERQAVRALLEEFKAGAYPEAGPEDTDGANS